MDDKLCCKCAKTHKKESKNESDLFIIYWERAQPYIFVQVPKQSKKMQKINHIHNPPVRTVNFRKFISQEESFCKIFTIMKNKKLKIFYRRIYKWW